ncbi:MAG: hypothetical protein PHI70_09960, partial [Proteiniphilum sp.]|nr:hypothetical protein [Proteiniphilum sp.]
DKDPSMVYPDRVFAFTGDSDQVGKRKGVFNHSRVVEDAFDKQSGFDVGGDRRQAHLSQTTEKSQ